MAIPQPTFKRIATIDVNLGLQAILNETPIVINGESVKVSGARLRTFLKGTKCVHCCLTGKFFAIEASKPNYKDFHLNLYATTPRGKEVLMTSDHIVPISKGGIGGLRNRQPMCQRCNLRKANKMPTLPVEIVETITKRRNKPTT